MLIMNNDCEKCGGRCCTGIIDVYSSDEIFYDNTLTTHMEEIPYDKVMIMDDNLKCIALKNGKCSIYEKRPLVCQEFKVGCSCCLNFQNKKLNSHSCEFCTVSDVLKNKKN